VLQRVRHRLGEAVPGRVLDVRGEPDPSQLPAGADRHGNGKSRGAIPTVVSLRKHFEQVWRSELNRLEPKLASLSPEARERVEDITRLVIEKLLLMPTEQLKSLGGDPETLTVYAEALSRLFGLDSAAAEPTSRGRVEPFPGPKNRASGSSGSTGGR